MKRLTKLGALTWKLHSLKTLKRRKLYLAVSQIFTLIGKLEKMICEIVSVSTPASIYSNGFVNDCSPTFTESLKTEGLFIVSQLCFTALCGEKYNIRRYI